MTHHDDAVGGDFQISVLVHDARRLAAKLKSDWRQVTRGSRHDDAGDSAIACKGQTNAMVTTRVALA